MNRWVVLDLGEDVDSADVAVVALMEMGDPDAPKCVSCGAWIEDHQVGDLIDCHDAVVELLVTAEPLPEPWSYIGWSG